MKYEIQIKVKPVDKISFKETYTQFEIESDLNEDRIRDDIYKNYKAYLDKMRKAQEMGD